MLPFSIDLHLFAKYKANYALTLITGHERSLCLSRYEEIIADLLLLSPQRYANKIVLGRSDVNIHVPRSATVDCNKMRAQSERNHLITLDDMEFSTPYRVGK